MRLKDLKDIFHKELDIIYGEEEVNSFFFMLIEDFYDIHRIELALQPETAITKREQEPIFKALDDLKNEIPIQHILGKTEFFGMQLQVNNKVLIPRPETEELVSLVLQNIKNQQQNSKTYSILDIGTGSGCIAISLAKNLPNARVYALDVSVEALNVAKQNAELNEVDIEFIKVDILNPETWKLEFNNLKFDTIVSNPPYVRQQEKHEIKSNVLNNEPHLALFVSDNDSLQFYKAIVQIGTNNLRENGLLFF